MEVEEHLSEHRNPWHIRRVPLGRGVGEGLIDSKPVAIFSNFDIFRVTGYISDPSSVRIG